MAMVKRRSGRLSTSGCDATASGRFKRQPQATRRSGGDLIEVLYPQITQILLNQSVDRATKVGHYRRSHISRAEVRTEIVKPKNGPKSCPAGILVMNRPGTDVSK